MLFCVYNSGLTRGPITTGEYKWHVTKEYSMLAKP